jgi:hypothetical protein
MDIFHTNSASILDNRYYPPYGELIEILTCYIAQKVLNKKLDITTQTICIDKFFALNILAESLIAKFEFQ